MIPITYIDIPATEPNIPMVRNIPMMRNIPMVMPRPRISLDPLIPVIRRILGDADLMRPLKSGVNCLDSGPLLNVCIVSLKNLPFAFYPDSPLVKEFDNEISCRLRYLEAAAMASASLVYNFVFATFFSIASLVTCGKIKEVSDQMRKHWVHAALALGSIGVGLAGTISPQLGIKANVAILAAVAIVLFQGMESDVVRSICAAYQRHRTEIQNAGMECASGDVVFYNREIAPFLTYLDNNLNDSIRNVSDLIHVGRAAAQRINFSVFASPDVLLDNGMQLLNHLARNWS